MAKGFWVNTNKSQAITAAIADLDKYTDKMQKRIRTAISDTTNAVRDKAAERVSVKTGTLKKSITAQMGKFGSAGFVTAKARYAHFVEFGAKAALIMPKKGRAIKIGNRIVHHALVPARKARPFMRPAADAEKVNLEKRIVEAVKSERH